jgi:hypothetical protein
MAQGCAVNESPFPIPPELQRLQAMLRDEQIRSASLGQRYSGLMNLFNAACTVNDVRDMENMRDQIHGIVDQILDSNATIYMLTRQVMAAAGRM